MNIRRSVGITPYLLAAASAAVFSFTGSILKLAENAGGSFWPIICLRATVALAVLLVARRRLPELSWPLAFRGSLLAGQFLLFAKAVTLTNPGMVTTLTYTSLVWVPLIHYFITKEQVTMLEIVTSVALLFAIAVSFLDQLSFQEHLGMCLALATGVVWSLGLVLTAHGSKQSKTNGDDVFILSAVMTAAATGIGWACEGVPLPPAPSLGWIGLGGLLSAAATLLVVPPLATIGSTRTNLILSTIDPAMAIPLAWLILGKVPGFFALVGGAFVVVILIVNGALLLLGERGSGAQPRS